MSRFIGCDYVDCKAYHIIYTPKDALSQERGAVRSTGGWVEVQITSQIFMEDRLVRYDLCAAHAALLAADQWREREHLVPSPEAVASPAPQANVATAQVDEAPSATQTEPLLACEVKGVEEPCGYPARDHCAAHRPRHCPGQPCNV